MKTFCVNALQPFSDIRLHKDPGNRYKTKTYTPFSATYKIPPLLHLHTQFNEELPYDTINMDFMNENQSAHGDREYGHIFLQKSLKADFNLCLNSNMLFELLCIPAL